MPPLTKNQKIFIGVSVVFLVLGAVLIIDAPRAQAGIGAWIMEGLAWICYGILWLISRLIALAAFLLEAVFAIENSTGFTKVTIVTQGWEITRGLCNMFFALILLLMAFDTILQTNKFPVKTILPKLILVALLINFSLVFCGVIIDFSQILTRFFIDAAGGPDGSIANQLANGLNIAKIFATPPEFQAPASGAPPPGSSEDIQKMFGGGSASLLAIFGTLVFGAIIILVAAFAIGAGAIFMFVRLVSLWVLLIFAPLAWVFAIAPLPGLSNVVGDWWKKFFQWTFFAPIYAFFIYLAVLAAHAPIFKLAQTTAQKQASGNIFVSGFLSPDNGLSLLMQYAVVIIILLTGLKTAQSSGLAGADKVVGWGKSARQFATSAIGGFVERGLAKGAQAEGTGLGARLRRASSWLAPTPWKKAWEARRTQKEREAFPVAIGARQDFLNKVLPGREETDYRQQAERFRVSEERKNIITKNAEELIQGFENAKDRKNSVKMRAYLMALAEQGDENELMKYYNKEKGAKYKMTAQGWTDFIKENLAPITGEQTAFRTGHDLMRVMETTGRWVGRPFKYDIKTGLYSALDKTHSAKDAEFAAHAEWTKEDPQKQAINLARHSLITETYDENGNGVDEGLSDFGKEKLKKIQANQTNRMKQQTKEIAMFNHAVDAKMLNRGFYDAALKEIEQTTASLDDAGFNDFVEKLYETLPKASTEARESSIKQIKADLAELREKPEKKSPAGFRV